MFILLVSATTVEASISCSRQLSFLRSFGACRWSKWWHVFSTSAPAVVLKIGTLTERIMGKINLNFENTIKIELEALWKRDIVGIFLNVWIPLETSRRRILVVTCPSYNRRAQ